MTCQGWITSELIYGSPFYIIIYMRYKLSMYGFIGPLCILHYIHSNHMHHHSHIQWPICTITHFNNPKVLSFQKYFATTLNPRQTIPQNHAKIEEAAVCIQKCASIFVCVHVHIHQNAYQKNSKKRTINHSLDDHWLRDDVNFHLEYLSSHAL